jgi:pyridoxal phosphate enzyme (YggS family)
VTGAAGLDPDLLRAELSAARERLDEAAGRSGRPPGTVELLLAGKYVAVEEVPALLAAGVRRLGENRLQDLQAKSEAAGGALEFDFIGHLQRRKVRAVLPAVRLIHTLDSIALAAEIAKRAEGPKRLLVEVNVGEEPTKPGIVPGDVRRFVDDVSRYPEVVIGGLMAMPPAQRDAERSRPHFAVTRELAERLAGEWTGRHDFADLSMGTSQDYVVAAEEGATIVRVGRGVIERARGG